MCILLQIKVLEFLQNNAAKIIFLLIRGSVFRSLVCDKSYLSIYLDRFFFLGHNILYNSHKNINNYPENNAYFHCIK